MFKLRSLWVAVIAALVPLASFARSAFDFPQGQVELVHSDNSLGLHFKLNKEWHVYWKNSGDSGAAPKWSWNSKNIQITKVHWPVPQRIPVAGLINFGYSHETLFRFDYEKINDGAIEDVSVDLEFLVCKVECIPYFTSLSGSKNAEETFARFRYPTDAPDTLNWIITSKTPGQLVTLLQPYQALKEIKNLEIFPEDGALFKAGAPVIVPEEKGLRITLDLQDTQQTDFDGSRFLFVIENQEGEQQALNVKLGDPKPLFITILIWGLIGGFILNFMPCVFPVLSVKVLSFLGPNSDKGKLRKSGWAYTFGVLVSFLALGSALLMARAAGEQIGWGFQLQSPVVAGAIAILFVWLGFNFLGFYEIGQSLVRLGGRPVKDSIWGSFLTGVLATVVATPCTAPFMGAALGATLTMPATETLVVFTSLGLGLAFPFLALTYFPWLLRHLPKPGMWMQRLKEALAFPLFLTSLWLLWVISMQVESAGILYVLFLFIFVGFWIWLAKLMRSERMSQWFLVFGFIFSLFSLTGMPNAKPDGAPAAAQEVWSPYSAESVQKNLQNAQAVFIDFTAAWCITCQVNKKLVLNTDAIQKLFKENEVILYKADWTNKDPKITVALESYGRNSLPLYVYYAVGSQTPQILPEILTTPIIEGLFNKEDKK